MISENVFWARKKNAANRVEHSQSTQLNTISRKQNNLTYDVRSEAFGSGLQLKINASYEVRTIPWGRWAKAII